MINQTEAALYYYRQTGAKLPHRHTIKSWMEQGKLVRGKVIVLKSKRGRLWGRWVTTKQWMDEFIHQIEEAKR